MEKLKANNRILREFRELSWQIVDAQFIDDITPMSKFELIKKVNGKIVVVNLYVTEYDIVLRKDLGVGTHFKLDEIEEQNEWIRNANMGA